MKFLCLRNYFIGSSTRTRWTKGEYYEGRLPNEIESANGIAYYIKSNDSGPEGKLEYMVKNKDYKSYFKSIDVIREEKINNILGIKNGDEMA